MSSSTFDINSNEYPTVKQFYDQQCVLVTGATGCVGRMLVYRLLKTTNVARIYIICRQKKGLQVEARLEKYLASEIFDHLPDKHHLLRKITVIEGDVTLDCVGVSATDLPTIARDVRAVFHTAASINLQQSLK